MKLPLIPNAAAELDNQNALIIEIANVLSPEECAVLIARIEAAGPTEAPISSMNGFVMRPDIRNNTRVMFDDVELATKLFERVRPHVPERLQGEWMLCGANERMRCYRYAPGQYFKPHFDGAFVRSRDERSWVTFMIYLNECEAGGHTEFDDLGISVIPKTGSALLFNHSLWHGGGEVRAGVKYAVRSDLMYRRR